MSNNTLTFRCLKHSFECSIKYKIISLYHWWKIITSTISVIPKINLINIFYLLERDPKFKGQKSLKRKLVRSMMVKIIRYIHPLNYFWLLATFSRYYNNPLLIANSAHRPQTYIRHAIHICSRCLPYSKCSDCDWDISYRKPRTFICRIMCERAQNDFSSRNHKDKYSCRF